MPMVVNDARTGQSATFPDGTPPEVMRQHFNSVTSGGRMGKILQYAAPVAMALAQPQQPQTTPTVGYAPGSTAFLGRQGTSDLLGSIQQSNQSEVAQREAATNRTAHDRNLQDQIAAQLERTNLTNQAAGARTTYTQTQENERAKANRENQLKLQSQRDNASMARTEKVVSGQGERTSKTVEAANDRAAMAQSGQDARAAARGGAKAITWKDVLAEKSRRRMADRYGRKTEEQLDAEVANDLGLSVEELRGIVSQREMGGMRVTQPSQPDPLAAMAGSTTQKSEDFKVGDTGEDERGKWVIEEKNGMLYKVRD